MNNTSFNIPPREIIQGKYEILEKLGEGWEGEVYLVKELSTGIVRTAKFFFPKQNKHGRTAKFYAKKLHKLRDCDMVIHYHFQDTVFLKETQVTYLISEFIQGEMLSEYIDRQPKKHLPILPALMLLHVLAKGIEQIHSLGEYEGDLHQDNIMVKRKGLSFEVKVLDLMHLGSTNARLRQQDIVDLIHLFHYVLGGKAKYPKFPKEARDICCGLKRSLILKKFPTVAKLIHYLESMEWS